MDRPRQASARRRVRKTVHGESSGAPATVYGRDSLLPSRRIVTVATTTGTIRFRTHRFAVLQFV
ncbi:hypothetical protein ACGF07_13395 [Kitasatospora sp. NPDC048194]|uniref:hypothetical protein n=1 Tax=Kitasatospora sp. NPDC048194 TaxID=3364045 RepID=UPI003714F990